MAKVFEKKGLTKKSEDIAAWYNDVVLRSELAEYSDVKGCMIIRPLGYAIWEKSQAVLDAWFKDDGVKNVYFPIFIPTHLFEKEKKHVEGFSPELAVVTHGGGEELAEPLAIRPTSETVITQKLADWVQSHRDLPMKLNQWCNIVRWEKRTYPFLRTSEFLWQEGHTVHADQADAMVMVLKALEWYKRFYQEYFAISPHVGLKSESEKFAGAEATYAIELVMPDGRALQAATSHYLGTNFTKAFGVQYLDEKTEKQFAHQTSWGLSTRAIGGLVLSHGDDSGLVLPPQIAPIQAVILPIGNQTDSDTILAKATELKSRLKSVGIRVELDTAFHHSLGFRINEWELRGVPVRLELGAKELEQNSITAVRRDNFSKQIFALDEADEQLKELLETIQGDLLSKSEKAKQDLTVEVGDYKDFKKAIEEKKFARVSWCEDSSCELKTKEETKATSRVLELEHVEDNLDDKCALCGKNAKRKWLFAKSY